MNTIHQLLISTASQKMNEYVVAAILTSPLGVAFANRTVVIAVCGSLSEVINTCGPAFLEDDRESVVTICLVIAY